MTPIPTPNGRVIRTATGRDLVLTRTFRAPIEDVWASVTEPERTARWFGPWQGRPGAGQTIRYTMAFEQQPEDGPRWSEMTIETCDAPRHLELRAVDDETDVGGVGPGWEYYLDNLVASREGRPLPAFNDYYPAQRDYHLAQTG